MFTSFGIEVYQRGLGLNEAFRPGAPVEVRINSTDNLVAPVTFNGVWEATNFLAGIIEWFGRGLEFSGDTLPLADCGYMECDDRDGRAHGHDETGRHLVPGDYLNGRPLLDPEHWKRLGMEALVLAQTAGTSSDAQFWSGVATKRFARATKLADLYERGYP